MSNTVKLERALVSFSEKEAEGEVEEVVSTNESDLETAQDVGHQPKKVGWIRFMVLMIVEAIALGTLGMPAAYARLGMLGGLIITPTVGLIAIYTAWLVGQVKLRYPHVQNYPDAVRMLWGNTGYVVIATTVTCDKDIQAD